MKKSALLFAALLLAVGFANAQTTWKTDRAHSQVNFAVSHMVFSEVTGTFKDFDATLTSAKDDFSDAKVDATIKAVSIDTGNEKRDGHLKSNDFLNVEKFPDIKFKSTEIEKTGDDTYKITGDLTSRDITKPVVLDMKYRVTITDPRGNTRSAFKATTTVDRFEFGTTWASKIDTGGLVAGKEVEVVLLFEFVKEKK